MRYLLLLINILVMLVQGLLDQHDWWILLSNWILAGIVTLSLVMVFDHQRLAGFNNGILFFKGWVMLTTMLNLNSIYLCPDMTWWRMDLLILGYVALVSVGTGCWQNATIPIRALMFGMIIALMTFLYAPMILSVIFVILFFFYLSSYSNRNMVGLFTGVFTACWILYCVYTLMSDEAKLWTMLVQMRDEWNTLHYQLPAFRIEGYTGLIYVGISIASIFIYAVIGFISGNFNSLRMRSNIMLQCSISLLLIAAMPSCWTLYLAFAFISLLIHLLFTLSDHPERISTLCARMLLTVFLLLSVAEVFIRWAAGYIIEGYEWTVNFISGLW